MPDDDYELLPEDERRNFEVAQHLEAQRRLREIEGRDTKAAVAKMLARVVPGAAVCSMEKSLPGSEEDEARGKKRKRAVCGAPGVRMLALTGQWTCAEHDPLLRPTPGRCSVCSGGSSDG